MKTGGGTIFKYALSNKYSTGIEHHRFSKTLLPFIRQLLTIKFGEKQLQ